MSGYSESGISRLGCNDTNDGSDELDLPTVIAYAFYLRPEDDRSLGQEAFMRKCPSCKLPFNVRSVSQDFKVERTSRKIKYLFFL